METSLTSLATALEIEKERLLASFLGCFLLCAIFVFLCVILNGPFIVAYNVAYKLAKESLHNLKG